MGHPHPPATTRDWARVGRNISSCPFLRIAEVDWTDVQAFHDHQYFLGGAGRNQQPASGAIRLEQSDSVEISLVYGPMLN